MILDCIDDIVYHWISGKLLLNAICSFFFFLTLWLIIYTQWVSHDLSRFVLGIKNKFIWLEEFSSSMEFGIVKSFCFLIAGYWSQKKKIMKTWHISQRGNCMTYWWPRARTFVHEILNMCTQLHHELGSQLEYHERYIFGSFEYATFATWVGSCDCHSDEFST